MYKIRARIHSMVGRHWTAVALVLSRDFVVVIFTALLVMGSAAFYTPIFGQSFERPQTISQGVGAVDQTIRQVAQDTRRDDKISTNEAAISDLRASLVLRTAEDKLRDARINTLENKENYLEGGIAVLGALGLIVGFFRTVMRGPITRASTLIS